MITAMISISGDFFAGLSGYDISANATISGGAIRYVNPEDTEIAVTIASTAVTKINLVISSRLESFSSFVFSEVMIPHFLNKKRISIISEVRIITERG